MCVTDPSVDPLQQGILDVLKWELSAEQFEALCKVTQHSTVPLSERAFSTERAPSASYY